MKKYVALLTVIGFFSLSDLYADSPRETPIVKIVKNNAPAVVSISTEKLKNVGSGVILDKEGIVVTNAHVVNMTTGIFIILNDGTQVKGEVKYENPAIDLAIVKIIPPNPLKEVRIGQTGDLMVGETAIAIGNPLGLENSVSVGVISGKDRTLYSQNGQPVMSGLIQTDTPINPGNSGGALLNLDGELIGINTAMVQNSQGIGFAIPVEKVKEVLENYRKNKTLAQPAKTPYQNVSNIGYSNAQLNMEETKKAYILTLDIKGLDKNKINIEVNPNSITISGQRSEQKEEKRAGVIFSSSSMSSFYRAIPIPQNVNPQTVTTEVKGDTLLIKLPKKP